ncbi:MAG: VanZ family protein [Lachnospiraceae bacterium]|nr:VanZ family protein [Lachnospiraceae bacterium]
MKKRIFVTFTAGLLLLLLYCLIFGFSEQDGETSGNLSHAITQLGVKFFNEITGGRMTQHMIESAADYFEHPLRKAAHFGEYAVMGILTYSFLYYNIKSKHRRYIMAVIWVFVSAAMDEIHQFFVPGRFASAADVLLDTCGGAFGAFLCTWIVRVYKRRHEKNSMKKQQER